jgi:hypothetical protein
VIVYHSQVSFDAATDRHGNPLMGIHGWFLTLPTKSGEPLIYSSKVSIFSNMIFFSAFDGMFLAAVTYWCQHT